MSETGEQRTKTIEELTPDELAQMRVEAEAMLAELEGQDATQIAQLTPEQAQERGHALEEAFELVLIIRLEMLSRQALHVMTTIEAAIKKLEAEQQGGAAHA